MLKSTDPSDFFGRLVSLKGDNCTAQEGERINTDQTGQGKMAATYRGHKGVITNVFPATNTYDVQTERSHTLHGVLRLAQSPGDKRMLPIGTQVCVTEEFGSPMIIGVLHYTTSLSAATAPTSLTDVPGMGADDPINPTNAAANFRTNDTPRDIGENDWAEVSPDGNAMAALAGGVNLMKSSAFAQIRTHLINDLVEIISHKFRHVTSMGFSEVKNEGGRNSYVFRGGTDQLSEAGSDQENWTIRLDAGGTGDLFKFELTQPDGTSVFRMHVTPDGKADLYAAKGFNWKDGEQTTKKSLKDEITEVKGSVTRTVGGGETHKVRGTRNTVVSSNNAMNVGNDATESVVRHFTKSVGGDAQYKFIGGSPATATPNNVALDYEIVNGSWRVSIGDPASLASPAAVAGFDLETFIGSISLSVKTRGSIDLATTYGDVTLKTTVGNTVIQAGQGYANIDAGQTVSLGDTSISLDNPILKGKLHTTAMSTYISSNTSAYSTLVGATSAAAAIVGSGLPSVVWPMAAPVLMSWMTAVVSALGALLGSNAALQSALPGTLSTKAFTE